MKAFLAPTLAAALWLFATESAAPRADTSGMSPGAAREIAEARRTPAGQPTLPKELAGTLVYEFQGEDHVAGPGTPWCIAQRWTASLRVTLRLVSNSPTFAQYEAVDGAWEMEGSCSGEYSWERGDDGLCTWNATGSDAGKGSFRGGDSKAVLHVFHTTGEYGFGFTLNPVEHQWAWRKSGTCSPYALADGSWRGPTFRTGGVGGKVVLAGSTLSIDLTGTRRWNNPNHESAYVSTARGRLGPVVIADAGGPYRTTRGERVALDGSRSTGPIASYDWTFAPLSCPEGIDLVPGSRKEGARATVVPLCSVLAILTVRAEHATDSDTAEIAVAPRGGSAWTTPVTHDNDWEYEGLEPGAGKRWDLLPVLPEENKKRVRDSEGREVDRYTLNIVFAENVCAVDGKSASDLGDIVHPHPVSLVRTWMDNGYVVDRIHDPSGPFHEMWYVVGSDLRVERKAVFNPHIHRRSAPPHPEASENFYHANKARKVDIDQILARIERHEGWGDPKVRRSGHTGAMREVLEREGKDPRAVLESLIGRDRSSLQIVADRAIETIDREMSDHSKDPLAGDQDEALWLWDTIGKRWVLAPAVELHLPADPTLRPDVAPPA